MICNFPMECWKPAIRQKTTKNERIIPAEQQAKSLAISQVQ